MTLQQSEYDSPAAMIINRVFLPPLHFLVFCIRLHSALFFSLKNDFQLGISIHPRPKIFPKRFLAKKSRGLHVKKCTRKALRKLTDDSWFVSSKY